MYVFDYLRYGNVKPRKKLQKREVLSHNKVRR